MRRLGEGAAWGSCSCFHSSKFPRTLGVHAVLAGTDSESEAAIRLHTRFEFREVARFREIGRSTGRWLNAIFVKSLLAPEETREAARLVADG
jgi:hypothetical protein